MSSFKNEAIIKYPINKVFNVIVDAAKRDFDSFTENENTTGFVSGINFLFVGLFFLEKGKK